MSKTQATLAILGLMVFLLFLNAVVSCRENFVEGLENIKENMDVSGGTPPPALQSMMNKVKDSVTPPAPASGGSTSTSAALASAIGAAAPTATEGFDNIFQNHYSGATSWNNTNDKLFQNVPFKPECCNESGISSSTGCACLSKEKASFMHHHGNND
jgi:hypothetical protein